VATQSTPTLLTSTRCTAGLPVEHPIRSFLVLPRSDHLLTLEGKTWITRSVRSGLPDPSVPPSMYFETTSMWTDRVSSPDGVWLIALNGQASFEVRNRQTLERREMLTLAAGTPVGYGFWSADSSVFLVAMENGVTEAWDLKKMTRLSHSPEPVGDSAFGSHWPPTYADGTVTLNLIPTRAFWYRKNVGPQGEFRPIGRWPIVAAAWPLI